MNCLQINSCADRYCKFLLNENLVYEQELHATGKYEDWTMQVLELHISDYCGVRENTSYGGS